MHILQPKQTKMSEDDATKLLESLNIAKSQLPKVFVNDAGLPDDCIVGDVIKIERKDGDEINLYYRVIV